MKRHSFLIFFLFNLIFSSMISSGLQSQETIPSSKEEIDEQYKKNIKKSRINGVYIPKDIDDAYEEFLHLSPGESLDEFARNQEDLVAKKLHFGLGRWMIVNWSFYEGSRLSHLLREKGLPHPDDMANFLIRVFHRKMNKKELDMDSLINGYKIMRAEELEKKGRIFYNSSSGK